jgi:hypothetical protein
VVRFDSLFGTAYVKGFVDRFMEESAFCFNSSFIPKGGKRGQVVESGLEEKPISSFPHSCGSRRGGVKIKVNPDGDMVRKRGGVMNSPVREGGR